MRIDSLIKRIFSTISIVDYLSTYYGLKFEKFGNNYRTVCPLHPDKDPSFTITQGKEVWYCFGCKQGGSLITFVEKVEKINRMDAIRLIAKNCDVDILEFVNHRDIKIYSIMEEAFRYFLSNVGQVRYISYFENKGFDIKDVVQQGVGYSISEAGLYEHLVKSGYSQSDIWGAGLVGIKFVDSIVFPIRNKYGLLSHFKCRLFSDVKFIGIDENSSTFEPNVYNGMHSIRSGEPLILVEGDCDYLALKIRGFNVMSMGGLKINEDLLDFIVFYEINKIYLWVDGDYAGWSFIQNLNKNYGDLFCKRNLVCNIIYIENIDPDEYVMSVENVQIESILQTSKILPIFVFNGLIANNNIIMDWYDFINDILKYCQGYDNLTREYVVDFLHQKSGFSKESLFEKLVSTNKDKFVDYGAESELIVAILNDPQIIHIYNMIEEWFVSKAYQIIFNQIKQGNNKSNIKSVVPVWVVEYIDKLPFNEKIFIQECVEVIKNLYDKRQLQDIITKVSGFQFHEDALGYLNESIIKLYKGSSFQLSNLSSVMKNIISKLMNNENTMGYSLGKNWAITDSVLLGIRKSKLIYLAGSTGHGKTNIILNWVYSLSIDQNYKGLIFSGEMDEEEIMLRIMSIGTGISNTNLTINAVNDRDMDKIFGMAQAIKPDNLFIHDNMNFTNIINTIRYAKIKYGIDYVMLDYLHLIEPSRNMLNMGRPYQLKEMTRRLKNEICQELDLPVILVGQLSDQALDDATPLARRSSESKLVQSDCDVTIAMRQKNKKELELDPVGNIIFHIDKVRYNKSNTTIRLDFNFTSLTIKEARS